MKRATWILILLACVGARARAADVCPNPVVLRATSCPAGSNPSCTNKGAGLTNAEIDAIAVDTLAACRAKVEDWPTACAINETLVGTGSGTMACGAGGGMVYPGAGVPKSTGAAWDTSYTVGASASNIPQIDADGRLALPYYRVPTWGGTVTMWLDNLTANGRFNLGRVDILGRYLRMGPEATGSWSTAVIEAHSLAINGGSGFHVYPYLHIMDQWSNVSHGAYLFGAANDILEERHGTDQQTFRVYNTWGSSGTNYERLTLTGTVGSSVEIKAESGGTGAANLDLKFTPKGSGNITLGAGHYVGDLTGNVTGNASGTAGSLAAQYVDWSAASGGASIANKPSFVKCMTIDTPAATDPAWFMWKVPTASTVTAFDCIVGASTSAVMTPQRCDANGASCVDLTTAGVTCATTNTAGTPQNTALSAGQWVRLATGTVTGTVGQVSACVSYTTP